MLANRIESVYNYRQITTLRKGTTMTYLYKYINFSDFCDAFFKAGRGDNFTYEAKKALFEYLEEQAQLNDEPIELDVVALCCEFEEYENLIAWNNKHGNNALDIDDVEKETQAVIRIYDNRGNELDNFITTVF